MMNLLVSVEAPDPDTFVITMSEPYYPMLTELGVTRPFAMISPKSMINGSTKDGVSSHIGTGPYILTDFVIDDSMDLKNLQIIYFQSQLHTAMWILNLMSINRSLQTGF